ncbi:MAG: YicC/YloC family endoribonuclease [Pirellulaceae bacterium]
MLTSMTGHGEATVTQGDLSAAAEIRSTNNRYFKLSARLPDGYASLEPQLERLIRQTVRRGSVNLSLKLDRASSRESAHVNVATLSRYRQQLAAMEGADSLDLAAILPALLQLPGVIDDGTIETVDLSADGPILCEAVTEALLALHSMRVEEGLAMGVDLETNLSQILIQAGEIRERIPAVAAAYQDRLLERINKLLTEHALTIEPSDIVREVGLFVDRSDISEELVRLSSHIEQFRSEMQLADPQGRKLDFLTQEMFREANTLASKSNDSQVSTWAIEIKTTIERMREMIQNVE